ncbi:MAG: HD domain-containing protein, partial [Armatimonadetes bacterium]|nr:HD domain-containing protein [Armatimonadota bacterium]
QVQDVDVIVVRPESVAGQIAQIVGARVVALHGDPVMLRVPFGSQKWLDVCAPAGADIKADLATRDFTINALAADLRSGELLDPFGGVRDLRAGIIRVTDPSVIDADPARILRAYRLSADLGFRIAPRTAAHLRDRAHRLADAAGARLGREMLKWLSSDRPVAETIAWAVRDEVLVRVLPQLADMRGIGRGGYHHLDALDHTLEALRILDRLLAAPTVLFRQGGPLLEDTVADPAWRAVARAAVLLHDTGKPAALYVDERGRTWFRGHEEISAAMAADLLTRWAWPRRLREAVERVVREHMRPLQLAREAVGGIGGVTERAWLRLVRDVGLENFRVLVLAAAADVLAARGPASRNDERNAMIALLDGRLAGLAEMETRGPEPLVDGRTLMAELGIAPGPAVGHLLREIERAREQGTISTREEALELARKVLQAMREAGWNK